MKLSPLAALALVGALLVSAGCLRALGLQRGTTPDGRPSMELCAELAKAVPSASSSTVAVASAAPSSSASALPSAPAAGVLQHAK